MDELNININNVEVLLQTIEISKNTVIVLRYPSGSKDPIIDNLINLFLKLESKINLGTYMVMSDELSISLIDEDEMKTYGWIRDPKRKL